jgi:hypothetical protein
MIGTSGTGFTVTTALPREETVPAAFVAEHERVTGPFPGAVQEMEAVPWPEVIPPAETVQVKVQPG